MNGGRQQRCRTRHGWKPRWGSKSCGPTPHTIRALRVNPGMDGGRQGGLSLLPTQFSGHLLSDGRTVTQSGWHWTVTVKRSSFTFIYNLPNCTRHSFSDRISSFQNLKKHVRWRCNEILLLAVCYQVTVTTLYVFVCRQGGRKIPRCRRHPHHPLSADTI